MSTASPRSAGERGRISSARALANQAFSRAAGAPLIAGNTIRLLRNAQENYPAWLDAIHSARRQIHFETYIFHEDATGRVFADALIAKARAGVRVRLIYDWLGGLGTASRRLWNEFRASGVDVRSYNPARWDSPLGWLSRDHRKTLCVDGEIGFVSGLCVGRMWAGDAAKNIEPWRDTGVEVRGPAVAQLDQAFAAVWAITGEPIPEHELASPDTTTKPQGEVALRVVASTPTTGGMFRVDQLVAALATKRLWLTDAYYAGMPSYVQGLRSAAQDGVDVRLLVPNATDVPLLKPLSRAGYRTLLEAGVRIFEWNGTMLHAKTAVADGRWARVGSTNLNVASWFGNCEMDVVVEDEAFAQAVEAMYLTDLENASEVVLEGRKVRAPNQPRNPHRVLRRGDGTSGRAAAGAVRLANVVGAAFTHTRVIEPIEARIAVWSGALLLLLAVLFAVFPRALAYPLVLLFAWIAAALLVQGYKLHRERLRRRSDKAAPP